MLQDRDSRDQASERHQAMTRRFGCENPQRAAQGDLAAGARIIWIMVGLGGLKPDPVHRHLPAVSVNVSRCPACRPYEARSAVVETKFDRQPSIPKAWSKCA